MDHQLKQQFKKFVEMKKEDFDQNEKSKGQIQKSQKNIYERPKSNISSDSSSFPSDADEYLRKLDNQAKDHSSIFEASESSDRTHRTGQFQIKQNSLSKLNSASFSISNKSTILVLQKENSKSKNGSLNKSNYSQPIDEQNHRFSQEMKIYQNSQSKQKSSQNQQGLIFQIKQNFLSNTIQSKDLSGFSSSPQKYLSRKNNTDFKKKNLNIIKNNGLKMRTQKSQKGKLNQDYLKSIQMIIKKDKKNDKQNKSNFGKQFYQLGIKLNESEKSNDYHKQKRITINNNDKNKKLQKDQRQEDLISKQSNKYSKAHIKHF